MALECGIDEAGRGCIAGSLFIACVILDNKYKVEFKKLGIKDSKKLNESQHKKLADEINIFLSSYNGFSKIVRFNSYEIDSMGLGVCIKQGLLELQAFANTYNCKNIIFDGNTNFGVNEITTIIKGDSKETLISAASILAKNSKNIEMNTLHKQYPLYDFKNNKGYLTKKHKDSIIRYGYTKEHRKSYNIKSLKSKII